MRQVTLRKVSLLTSGVYRCEVTSKLSPAGIDSEVKEDRLVVLGEFSTLIYSRLRLHIRCFLGLQFEIAHLNVKYILKSDNLQYITLGHWGDHLTDQVADGPSIILILKIKQWVAGLDLGRDN